MKKKKLIIERVRRFSTLVLAPRDPLGTRHSPVPSLHRSPLLPYLLLEAALLTFVPPDVDGGELRLDALPPLLVL